MTSRTRNRRLPAKLLDFHLDEDLLSTYKERNVVSSPNNKSGGKRIVSNDKSSEGRSSEGGIKVKELRVLLKKADVSEALRQRESRPAARIQHENKAQKNGSKVQEVKRSSRVRKKPARLRGFEVPNIDRNSQQNSTEARSARTTNSENNLPVKRHPVVMDGKLVGFTNSRVSDKRLWKPESNGTKQKPSHSINRRREEPPSGIERYTVMHISSNSKPTLQSTYAQEQVLVRDVGANLYSHAINQQDPLMEVDNNTVKKELVPIWNTPGENFEWDCRPKVEDAEFNDPLQTLDSEESFYSPHADHPTDSFEELSPSIASSLLSSDFTLNLSAPNDEQDAETILGLEVDPCLVRSQESCELVPDDKFLSDKREDEDQLGESILGMDMDDQLIDRRVYNLEENSSQEKNVPLSKWSMEFIPREGSIPLTKESIKSTSQEENVLVIEKSMRVVSQEESVPLSKQSITGIRQEERVPLTNKCIRIVTQEEFDALTKRTGQKERVLVTKKSIRILSQEEIDASSKKSITIGRQEESVPLSEKSISGISQEESVPLTNECIRRVTQEQMDALTKRTGQEESVLLSKKSITGISQEDCVPLTNKCIRIGSQEDIDALTKGSLKRTGQEESGTLLSKKSIRIVSQEEIDALTKRTGQEISVPLTKYCNMVVSQEEIDALTKRTGQEESVPLTKNYIRIVSQEEIDALTKRTDQEESVPLTKKSIRIVSQKEIVPLSKKSVKRISQEESVTTCQKESVQLTKKPIKRISKVKNVPLTKKSIKKIIQEESVPLSKDRITGIPVDLSMMYDTVSEVKSDIDKQFLLQSGMYSCVVKFNDKYTKLLKPGIFRCCKSFGKETFSPDVHRDKSNNLSSSPCKTEIAKPDGNNYVYTMRITSKAKPGVYTCTDKNKTLRLLNATPEKENRRSVLKPSLAKSSESKPKVEILEQEDDCVIVSVSRSNSKVPNGSNEIDHVPFPKVDTTAEIFPKVKNAYSLATLTSMDECTISDDSDDESIVSISLPVHIEHPYYKKEKEVHKEQKHLTKAAQNSEVPTVKDKNKVQSEEWQCVCDVCGRVFTSQLQFYQHMTRHYGFKLLVCKYCKKGFAEKREYMEHLKSHETTDFKTTHQDTLNTVHKFQPVAVQDSEIKICSSDSDRETDDDSDSNHETDDPSDSSLETDDGEIEDGALRSTVNSSEHDVSSEDKEYWNDEFLMELLQTKLELDLGCE